MMDIQNFTKSDVKQVKPYGIFDITTCDGDFTDYKIKYGTRSDSNATPFNLVVNIYPFIDKHHRIYYFIDQKVKQSNRQDKLNKLLTNG
jgi:hypothetical protein